MHAREEPSERLRTKTYRGKEIYQTTQVKSNRITCLLKAHFLTINTNETFLVDSNIYYY